jgi:hypothetical protein
MDRILRLGAQGGFREWSRGMIERMAQSAVECWRAFTANQPLPGEGPLAAAPPACHEAGRPAMPGAWVAGEAVPGDPGSSWPTAEAWE